MSTQGGPQFGAQGGERGRTCPRHPRNEAPMTCGRCGRPVCVECRVSAPVGIQCRDCVREGARQAPTPRTIFGGVARPGAQPVVTYALMGVCIVLWLLQLVSEDVTNRMLFSPVLGVAEPWRFLTACFVHLPGNPTHLAFNMFALWSVGRVLEPLLGRARYIALYLLSGLGGSVAMLVSSAIAAQYFHNPDSWFGASLGASGAVFGLFGAYFVATRRLGADSSGIIGLLVINLLFPLFVGGIAWEAHIGGLIVGALVMALLAARGNSQRRDLPWLFLAVTLVILGIITGITYGLSPLPVATSL